MFAIENWGMVPGVMDDVFLTPGTQAQWVSEIMIWEDDMAGTASEPCILEAMSVEVQGGGQGDGFQLIGYDVNDACFSDDTLLWIVARTADDRISIFDKFPNTGP